MPSITTLLVYRHVDMLVLTNVVIPKLDCVKPYQSIVANNTLYSRRLKTCVSKQNTFPMGTLSDMLAPSRVASIEERL